MLDYLAERSIGDAIGERTGRPVNVPADPNIGVPGDDPAPSDPPVIVPSDVPFDPPHRDPEQVPLDPPGEDLPRDNPAPLRPM